MTAARTFGGVKHGKRCACPLCDPQQRLLARQREEARAARLAPRPAPALPLALDRPRPALPARPMFETEKTKRFRDLLRAGVPAVRAMEQLDAEERANRHAD